MPCFDPLEGYDREHNNVAGEHLCTLLKTMPEDDPRWTPQLRQWWADHQDRDAYYARKSRGG